MPLETADFIIDLQPDWPLGTDPEAQGDDHLRMIKQVLQNTFPNLDGAVTGTPTGLNNLTDGALYLEKDAENNGFGVDTWNLITVPTDGSDPVDALLHIGTVDIETANLHPGFAVNWQMIMDIIYPIGRVIFSSKSDNPATYLGFGTWTQRAGSIYGAGSTTDSQSMSGSVGAGKVNGNWRIPNNTLVATTLNLTMNAVAAHSHGGNRKAGNNSGTSGKYIRDDATSPDSTGVTYDVPTNSAGGHTPSGKVTIGSGSNTSGSAYYAPGYAFYVWERTA